MSTAGPRSLRLDLDQVVDDYVRNLNVMLRGFKAVEGCDFLETFVPSEDPAASVCDLVELSRDAGVEHLVISMAASTAARLDRERLAGAVGHFIENRTLDGLELVFARSAAIVEPLADIHPAYRRKLADVSESVEHERPVPGSATGRAVSAERDGVVLWAVVNPVSTMIEQAGFVGCREPVRRGLLEAACRLMEGIPLVEASDHVVIRLEAQLRDEAAPPPVRGVVLPRNAGAAFEDVERLVRDLVSRYRTETGCTDVGNMFDEPVAESWLRSTNDRRLAAARDALQPVAGAGDLDIARLDGLRRLVVHFGDGLTDAGAQQNLLVRAETHLRKVLRTPLQLVLEVKADKNVIRQLEPRKQEPTP